MRRFLIAALLHRQIITGAARRLASRGDGAPYLEPGAYNQMFGTFDISQALGEFARRVNPRAKQLQSSNAIARQFRDQQYLMTPPLQKIPKSRFNPSVVALPAAIAQKFGEDAHYLVVFRHYNSQCSNLGANETRKRERWDPRAPNATIAVLRKDFSGVASSSVPGTAIRYDCRLFADGDEIYLACNLRDNTMHLVPIKISSDGASGVRLAFGADLGPFGRSQRNLGVFKHNGHLTLLMHVEGSMDMKELSGAAAGERGAASMRHIMHDTGSFIQDESSTNETWLDGTEAASNHLEIHNNINPIELPGRDAFLGIGHVHLESQCVRPSRQLCHKYGPKYGWKYVSVFFLFQRGAPWALHKVSPGFCIPSKSNSSRCEAIQFIMSAILEGGDLLLTYGINDCEAAAVRVPLKAVMEFMEQGILHPSEVKFMRR